MDFGLPRKLNFKSHGRNYHMGAGHGKKTSKKKLMEAMKSGKKEKKEKK